MNANLHQVWLLRLNQDIEGCGRALAGLGESPEFQEEALYLKASLARACKKVDEANLLLDAKRAGIEAAGGGGRKSAGACAGAAQFSLLSQKPGASL